MADIARIITEVILTSKAAIASWRQFGDAGVAAFKRIAAEAQSAAVKTNVALTRMGTAFSNIGKSALTLGKHVRKVGSAITIGLGGPLLLLGKLALDAFKNADDGLGSSLRLVAANQKALLEFNKSLAGLGKALIPIQTQLLQFITTILKGFNSLSPSVQSLIIKVGLIAVALGPILFIASSLITVFGGLATALGFIAPAFAAIVPVIAAFVSAGVAVITILGEVAVAVATAASWPVIIAAALGAIIVLAITHWDTVKQLAVDAMAFVGETIKNAWAGLGDVVNIAIGLWESAWNLFFAFLSSKWSGLGDFVRQTLAALVSPITNLINMAKDLWAWLVKAASVHPNVPAAGGAGTSRAHGGLIRGRVGVDKVAAWLTNKEFVHKVAAVRKYGLGFMNAVNQGRFPMALAQGFNTGGLVGQPRTHFATGGQALASRRVDRGLTLVIGGQSFGGLRVPADTAADLVRFSKDQQIKATGKFPGWVR